MRVCELLCLLPPRAMEALAKALGGWVSHASSRQAASSPRAAGTSEQCGSPGALLQRLARCHPASAASQVPQQLPPSFLQGSDMVLPLAKGFVVVVQPQAAAHPAWDGG